MWTLHVFVSSQFQVVGYDNTGRRYAACLHCTTSLCWFCSTVWYLNVKKAKKANLVGFFVKGYVECFSSRFFKTGHAARIGQGLEDDGQVEEGGRWHSKSSGAARGLR